MSVVTIALWLLGVVLIIIAIRYMVSDSNTMTGLMSAKTMQKVDASDLASDSAGSSNFTYSVWVFVDDWNYRYGEHKLILGRMITEGNSGSSPAARIPCPSIALAPMENNLIVSMAVYPSVTNTSETVQPNVPYQTFSCGVANFPIQKWTNILISVDNRTLDVYLNGKLVRTCVLPGVAKVDATAPVFVTPMGGFSGWTSKVQYWDDASDPQEAWNIYSRGYGGSWIGNLFNTYSVKVSLMEGDVEDTSFTL